jgi:threonine/homoserine/homoserine lactone efflux protein
MSLDLYLAFVAATAVLILIPGPNVALIVANSIAHGRATGLMTVAGTSGAMVLQLGLTVAGMSTVLALLADWFEWLRWAGVAYLVYLGVQAFRATPVALDATRASPASPSRIVARGFVVSLTNPKTLLFYGAFLPQFVTPGEGATGELVLLAVTFVVIAVLLDGTWALLAARFRAALALNGRLRNGLTGTLLLGAGLGLALARKG